MVNIDLSSTDLGRVAGQNVDRLRIADQDVWTATPPAVSLFSVFNNVPIDLQTYNDIGAGHWLMNQFELTAGPSLKIHALGMFVNTGSNVIGQTAQIGLQFGSSAFLSGGVDYQVALTNISLPGIPLAEGWNWLPFDSPVNWSAATPFVLAGYDFSPNYLYSATLQDQVYPSIDVNVQLVKMAGADTQPSRSFWISRPGVSWSSTQSKSYGIDLRVSIDA
jgi:hypothetical protein